MAVATRSIGQVLEILRAEYPDISISKIRYLESEGLLSPERDQPSGYRRYSPTDIERLRYILRTQRDQYLPLRVIRENLERMDRGLEPDQAVELPPEPAQPQPPEQIPPPVDAPAKQRPLLLTRRQVIEMSGLPEATLIELERQKIIQPRKGTSHYGRDALTLAIVARRISAYGLGVRHLRLIQRAAEQEAGLVDMTTAPYLRHRANGKEIVNDVTKLVVHAHVAMLQTMVNR